MEELDRRGIDSTKRVDAALFDMDGVITDTAQAHAVAWKRLFDEYLSERAAARQETFLPFDIKSDYREYVDGKPRHDGIESFLKSRGITLPYGSEKDGPDRETVRGLGSRKNHYFHAWLGQNTVRTFPAALKLIAELRKAGIKTAVFSSSCNAEAVLRNADVHELFDVKVDGNDLAERGLPGKPDPAMLFEAAARLGVAPLRTLVVEDSIAGVEAGARGEFGIVIGVDRGGFGDALRKAGAQIVVRHLGELIFDPKEGARVKTLSDLPLARDREDEIRSRLSGKALLIFLDYDGTLTPIVEDYTKAFLSDDMRAVLAELGQRCTVTVVSGRDVELLRRLVRIESMYYAGSHGFEISGPKGWSGSLEKGVEFLPQIDDAETALRAQLADIAGHAVERKRFSIAIHYRQAADEDASRIEGIVDEVISGIPGLRKGHGKKVYRIQPDIDWDKGRAVLWLLERLGLDHPGALAVYVGDDITDEDAFRALAGRGIALAVRDHDARPTAADYALTDPDDVKHFLQVLTALAGEKGKAKWTAGRDR